jgi:hypothetical protein
VSPEHPKSAGVGQPKVIEVPADPMLESSPFACLTGG